ncbi:LysR family transcriptional regulator substrate-binding protein [Corynebacterium urealyticum]|uniref:LysR family transcriptional regulator substrate-binding protein n=1 Tax=Corynebacterium urealyticum TaxID=43771 RepID=UPI0019105CE2|nr:LysR family transcriptional regulator substrate-binding protein [Corynebacterium urealyticum]QQE50571.1 LysR family transcriptional regulator substrate-binding protein [Corynebacterium urealyticum]
MAQLAPRYLRVVFSPGINPDKWFARFDDRVPGWRSAGAATDAPLVYIANGEADVAIVRLGQGGVPKEKFHAVTLYEEQMGVAAPKEHPIEVLDRVKWAELSDEMFMYTTPADGIDDLPQLREMLGVVAANVGIAVAPRPLLRALRVRGVVNRELLLPTPRGEDPEAGSADSAAGSSEAEGTAPVPELPGTTVVAVVWLKERDAEEIQEFVGICRGRKAGSSRGELSGAEQKRAGRAQRNATSSTSASRRSRGPAGARKKSGKKSWKGRRH